MDKLDEMRLQIRACEQVAKWAEDFRASEDEIWDILRDMAEHKVALRLSEFANAAKLTTDDICKALHTLAVEYGL